MNTYKNILDKRVIVSLTSFPERIKFIQPVLESLLTQTIQPDKIILWLAESQFPQKENDLPENILEFKNKIDIEWYEDIKSYKKLIPTLKKYPDDIIITVDDDIVFDNTMLEKLIESYIDNPNCIHAHRITRLKLKNNKLSSFKRKFYQEGDNYKKTIYKPSAFNKLTGGAGVLYPPHSLHKDVLDEELFQKLAPTSDDIWFHLQGLRNGYKVKLVKNNLSVLNSVDNTQEVALCRINDSNSAEIFTKHLNTVYNYYPELKEIFRKDNFDNILLNIEILLTTVMENIFSITKTDKKLIIKILGIKLSFKR